MKFARIRYQGKAVTGIVKGDEICVVENSMFEAVKETKTTIPIAEADFLPPTDPTKIVCVGQNYIGHIQEVGATVPELPMIFLKPPSCLIGHGDPIVFPKKGERVDYEGELAVIVKKRMKDVPEEEALDGVLGCTCFNDVTERAFQALSPFNLALSKAYDTFGPCGPFVVTDIDPNKLEVTTRLNGEIVQQDNTSNCVFTVQRILSYVSGYMTLEPGDIVITGTPKGIRPMKPGDTVEVEIEGIGILRNRVQAA